MRRERRFEFRMWKTEYVAILVASVLLLTSLPCSSQSEIAAHGYISTKFQLRQNGGEEDRDIFQCVGLDLGDTLKSGFTLHLLARGVADIDGERDHAGFYEFDDIDDTYDGSLTGRLYYAYVDVHRVEKMSLVRLGRQSLYSSPVVLDFDGVRLVSKGVGSISNLNLGFFGGVPVHPYESSRDGDVLYGLSVETRPWSRGRVELHWTHAEDEYLYGKAKNDHYSVALWQALHDYFRFHTEYTRLEEESRSFRLRTTFHRADWDFTAQASYFELLNEEKHQAIDFDPFYAQTGELFPYWRGRLRFFKGFGEKYGLEAGLDMRELKNGRDEGRRNHDFSRSYLTFFVDGLLEERLGISLTGEIWDSKNQVEKIETYGGDVTYKLNRKLRTSIGTNYALYRYDIHREKEKEKVRTYYARFRYNRANGVGYDVSYEYEDDEFAAYNTFKIGLNYTF